ncbi:hypothetical protein BG844_01010 [Couchioplanes caeruleus subsp. caeruleus]|uniref:Uncharacterized protein n=1 Tax=Couchioplanes caeruleus subsp. caeruleus TaxID=56427 RepID=A0A1K0FTG8_9ACTN|nr:hypothetical protein BG844_01010 [Couchioplanes caeruleus subsp. caeruleus]
MKSLGRGGFEMGMLDEAVAQFGEPAEGVVSERGVSDSEQSHVSFAVKQVDSVPRLFRRQQQQAAEVAGAFIGVR